MTKITLNGKLVEAPESMTVLEIAKREGIEIPTLCYHEALGPYGACRLCVVEAEGPMLRRTLVSSCTLPVSEGLSVSTNAPAVIQARKIIFELLLSRSFQSEQLREMAKRHGVESTRFGIVKDDDCVRCGLCIRACRDKIGTSAISFVGRGQKRRVSSEFGKISELCIGCGTCANICPTGAIRLEDTNGERTIFLKDVTVGKFTLIQCTSCGKAFTTKKFLEHVGSRIHEQPRTKKSGICPECARGYYADAIVSEFPSY